MKPRSRPALRHVTHYGQQSRDRRDVPGPVPRDFTFNSPVGLCMDRSGQVWVCDTGNNRLVILDSELKSIRGVLECPDPAGQGAGALSFRMPFHVCPHPARDRVFVTDMGNSRVVALDYDAAGFHFAFAFGDQAQSGFTPLQDPNGITVVRAADGRWQVHVNDEFFHTPSEPKRNRCVRFDEDGRYRDEFRTAIAPDGSRHDLYWPQGLSSDRHGNLYLANTGSYEILKCAAGAPIDDDYCIAAQEPVVAHRFGQAGGIGMLNIMRDVSVIGERVFVPDHVLNTISVYDLAGRPQTLIAGLLPTWNHGAEPVHSPTDPLYYAMEDAALLNPYVICQGEAEDIFLVSEPFSSRIVRLRIRGFESPQAGAVLLSAVGGRRDNSGQRRRDDPQFNCVTAVISLERQAVGGGDPDYDAEAELPDYLKLNPLQQWGMLMSAAIGRQAQTWCEAWPQKMLTPALAGKAADALELSIDAGNWRFAAYAEARQRFEATPLALNGFFLPGNLALAVYHPRLPLLGQICPGTPLLLVGNFNFGMVSLYQLGPLGNLLNYGLPFGMPGAGEGCLRGPQGIAVSDEGEVFVVDALNNRLSKWRILQTGQVVFIRNFAWTKGRGRHPAFTPTDVAIDGANRLFVTDQFNNRICVFDRHGESLWCCGKEGYWEEGDSDGERFMLPTSLAIDGERLIVNDLVNRALKVFRVGADGLEFESGISLFKRAVDQGGVWMPFFMHAREGRVHVADSTYNLVQVYAY